MQGQQNEKKKIFIAKLQILSEDDMNTLVIEDIVHHSENFICC